MIFNWLVLRQGKNEQAGWEPKIYYLKYLTDTLLLHAVK